MISEGDRWRAARQGGAAQLDFTHEAINSVYLRKHSRGQEPRFLEAGCPLPPHHEHETRLAIFVVVAGRGFLVVAMRVTMVMVAVLTCMLLIWRVVDVTVQRTETAAGDDDDRTDHQ
ncbi:MAG: hypothetical protein ED559_10030 [Phycisphaera sp.]|nr:MAG: hypothetical protein ED559_10030 [Phycisphaera sp.]